MPTSQPKDSSGNQTGAIVRLQVSNMGHIPAFKNAKRSILDKRTGRQRTLTRKDVAQWMCQCTAHFVSQLASDIPTSDGETLTVEQLQSLIALLPHDDCWSNIPVLLLTGEKCEKGQEGATITIQEIE